MLRHENAGMTHKIIGARYKYHILVTPVWVYTMILKKYFISSIKNKLENELLLLNFDLKLVIGMEVVLLTHALIFKLHVSSLQIQSILLYDVPCTSHIIT